MKTVFGNHSMVAHVWAQQTQEHGRGKNMFFEGNAIYSWGHHWTLAFFVDNSCRKFIDVIGGNVIINTQSRSVSTSQHLGEVYGAIRGLNYCRDVRIEDKDFVHAMKRVNDGYHSDELDKDDALIAEYAQYHHREYTSDTVRYQSLSEKYKHQFKRAPKQFRDIARSALIHANEYNRVINIMDGEMRLPSGRVLSLISGPEITRLEHLYNQVEEYLVGRNLAQNEAKAERERARTVEREKYAAAFRTQKEEIINAWRDGNGSDKIMLIGVDGVRVPTKMSYQWMLDAFDHETRLRFASGEIVTSRGARVPLDHAKLLIRACQRLTRATDTFVRIEPEQTIRVGHFSLDHIHLADKYIKIGCHTLTFDEINSFVDYASARLDIGVDTSYKLP